MAKCAGCGSQSGGCGCVVGDAADGGANNTPSITGSGAGTAANPYRFALGRSGNGPVGIVVPGLTLGSGGTATLTNQRVGKEVTASAVITLGTGFALPATLSVPLDSGLPMFAVAAAGRILGVGTLFDVSASAAYTLLLVSDGTANNIQLYAMGANGQRAALTASSPITLAAGDTLEFVFKYTVG
jgi:hypothetical protein